MAFKANHQLVRLCRKSVFSDNTVCDLDFRIHDVENVTMSCGCRKKCDEFL